MKNLFFNYSAIVLLLCLALITFYKSRKVKSKSNALYLVTLFVILLSAFSSSVCNQLENLNLGTQHLIMMEVFHTLYLLFHNWSLVTYFFYLFSLTDDWQNKTRLNIKNILLFIPIFATTLIIIVNNWYPLICYYDNNGEYHRLWPLFGILYVNSLIYCVYTIYYAIRQRELFTRNQFVTILLIFPFLAVSIVVELLTKYIVVESFFDSIALLFVCTNLQRPEANLNMETGFLNRKTYLLDAKKAVVSHKRLINLIINITNFESTSNMIGFKNENTFVTFLANNIVSFEKESNIICKNYYLEKGSFRVVISYRDGYGATRLANLLNIFFKNPIDFLNTKVNLVTNVCIINNPQDINDYDSQLAFESELLKPKYYTGQVLYAKDLYSADYYKKLINIDLILENALKNNGFKVYYQPIYSIKDKRFNSAEALLRLFDPEYGAISPDFFIPAAENNGLIFKITDYVLEEVCKFVSSEEFKKLNIDYVEVNLSAAECMQDNLSERVTAILNKYQVTPDKINIEITETALTLSEERLYKNMQKLVQTGVSLSLDDFGSGYSNLQRLTQLPLHIVKFDKSFIYSISDENIKSIMLSNMGQMIHQMQIKFLIEGVETIDILNYFEKLNCDFIQGYYFSKPISQEDFINFILRSHENN